MNQEELVREYEPILRFEKGENFFPMRVEEYVQHCSLHALEGDQGILHIPPEYVDTEDLADAYFSSMDHYLVYADLRVEDEAKAEALREWIERQKTVKGPDFRQFKKEISAKVAKLGVNLAQVFRPLHLPKEVCEQALT
jgi:predicted solute-binding protein